MQIHGEGARRHYRCSTNKKRGPAVCANSLSVRESIAREKILAAIREEVGVLCSKFPPYA